MCGGNAAPFLKCSKGDGHQTNGSCNDAIGLIIPAACCNGGRPGLTDSSTINCGLKSRRCSSYRLAAGAASSCLSPAAESLPPPPDDRQPVDMFHDPDDKHFACLV